MSEAKVVLSAVDETKAAFASVDKNLNGLKTSALGVVGALGALGTAAGFVGLVKGAIDAADGLNDLSKSTGIAVADLAGLKLLAKQSGTDLDGLAKGINRMSVEMGKAPEKFRALGITTKDNKEAFKQFADIFNRLPDIQQRNALAQAVFAKSWAEMAPALSEGGQKIGETMEKGARLSASTKEMSAAADEFNDKWAELTTTGGLLNKQVAPLLPLLNALADDMIELQGTTTGVSGEFRPLAEAFRAVLVLGGNVSFVLKGIGTDLGGMAAQMAALGRGDLAGFASIGKALKEDAVSARQAFDAWEQKMMTAGTTAKATAVAVSGMTEAQKKEAAAAAAAAAAFLAQQPAASDAYAAIIKGINEKIAASQLELKYGRELTEFEKFEIKTTTDLASIKKGLSAVRNSAAEAALAEAKAGSLQVAVQRSELQQAMDIAKERQRLVAEGYAQAGLLATANTEAARARLKTGADTLEQIAFETKLLTMNTREREVATAMRDLERQGIKKGSEAWDEYADSIAKATGDKAALQQQSDSFRDFWSTVDGFARETFTSIGDSGKNLWTRLRDTGKSIFLNFMYELTAKKWLFNFAAAVTGTSAGVAQAAGGNMFSTASGASSMLNTGAGLYGEVANGTLLGNIGAGWAGTGGSFASSVGAGLATDAMGATVAEGAAAATLGTGSSIAGMMAAIPGWGWAALAAAAVVSFMSHGGGPKTEAGYAPGGLNIAGLDTGGNMQGSQRGDVSTAQKISEGISASYAALATQLGIVDKKLDVGIFYSMDNAKGGTSLTQLQVTSSTGYNRGTRTGGIENVQRGDAALQTALAEETVRLLIDGLKNSDLPQQFKDVLNTLTSDAGNDKMQAAIDRITTARTQQLSLEEQLYDLTHTDAEKLLKTREKERAAVDPLNAALLEQVYAQQDLAAATTAATEKANAAASQREGLETQLLQLQGNTAELRSRELAKLDESNRALQTRIYALQDEAAAAKEASVYIAGYSVQTDAMWQAQFQAQQAAAQRYYEQQQALFNAGKGISAFIGGLSATRLDTASPEALLTANRSSYISDLSLAKMGDLDASNRITTSAQAYLDAQKGYTASGSTTQAVISQVISELKSLPTVQSYESQTAANTATLVAKVDQLTAQNASVVALLQQHLQLAADIGKTSIAQQAEIAENTNRTDFQLSAAPLAT